MKNKNLKKIVTIVIPTFNEEKDVGNVIKSLHKQTFKNFEIIIVDDGSTDKTREIIRKFKRVKLIEGQHKGPGFSRNLGAKNAKGKFLVFVDADMTFGKEYIKNLISPMLKNDRLIGTTHDYEVVLNTKNIWGRCWGKIRVSREDAKKIKMANKNMGDRYPRIVDTRLVRFPVIIGGR